MNPISTKLTLTIRLLAITVVLACIAALPMHAQTALPTPPDYTLYTSYYFGAGYQSVNWIVCGSTEQSEGCYGSGSLGTFGDAGALLEGNPSVSGNTVKRAIYVVDIAAGNSGTGVNLSVYKKTDVVSSSYDTTTVTLEKTVALPLTGGAATICSMAADDAYLFIGTNQSPFAYRVQKNNLSMEQVGGFSPPSNVTSITADKYGYVTVTFGEGEYQFGPNGESVGDGGGAWYMLNTSVALSTTTLPTSDAVPAERLLVRPKKVNTERPETTQAAQR
jgi:hypothetical protein